jgi:hypothetical protein
MGSGARSIADRPLLKSRRRARFERQNRVGPGLQQPVWRQRAVVALPIGALAETVKGIQILRFASDHVTSLLTELNRRYPEDSDPAWRGAP